MKNKICLKDTVHVMIDKSYYSGIVQLITNRGIGIRIPSNEYHFVKWYNVVNLIK